MRLHSLNIVAIEKDSNDEFKPILDGYKKMISRYAKLQTVELFNKKISQSQKKGEKEAKKSYSEAFEPYLARYNVFLHERGEMLDSLEFSKIFQDNSEIRFFIGGAYGFDEKFLKKADKVISLSKMTTSHKIAKLMLYEQIYRALTIVNKHPYHK